MPEPSANPTLFQSALVIIIEVSIWKRLESCQFTSLARRMLWKQIRSKLLASKTSARPLCDFPLKLPLEGFLATSSESWSKNTALILSLAFMVGK